MFYSSKIEAQRQNHFPLFNPRILRIIKVGKGLKDHRAQTGGGAGFMALFSDEQNITWVLSLSLAFNGICENRE